MNYQEIIQLQIDQRRHGLPFRINRRSQLLGHISVNDYVAIPIENVASFYDRNIDLPLKKTDGTEIGYLYFLKNFEANNFNALSEPQFVCLLHNVDTLQTFLLNLPHTFTVDYLVIYKQYFREYLSEYKQSAPLWGHINHSYSSFPMPVPLKKNIQEVVVTKHSRFTKELFYETSVRGIRHSLAFERYLKYYHLLEVNFDFDVIERIKSLNATADAKLISILLHEYKKDDIERLKYLLNTYCTDTNMLVPLINSVGLYLPVAREIFYEFSKDSNPLKDYSSLTQIIAKAGGFNFQNCKAHTSQCKDNDSYKKFLCSLCAYWIYRVRNSIAHKKIGEFIMTNNEEAFVLNFAEPLLMGVLNQVFK